MPGIACENARQLDNRPDDERSLLMPADNYLSIDDLLKLIQPSDPQIHPDGELIAYTRASVAGDKDNPTGTSELWLTGDGKGDRRISAPDTHARSPRWSPAGERLAFLGKPKGAKHHQLCLLEPDWGEARVLTNLKARVSDVAWSPDGTMLALIAQDPPPDDADERSKAGRDWIEYEEQHRFDRLWLCDPETGELHRPTDADLHVYEFAWSPDGARIVAVAADRPYGWSWYRARLVIFHVPSGEAWTLHEPEKQIARPAWSPDGAWVSVVSCIFSDEGMSGGDVLLVDPDSCAAHNITNGQPRSYLETHWDDDGRSMLCPVIEDGLPAIYRLALDGAARRLWSEQAALTPFGGAISRVRDGSAVALVTSDSLNPPDVWRGRLRDDGIDWMCLTDANPAYAGRAAGRLEVIHWKSFDGLSIQGLLLRPHDAPEDTPLPMVTLIHGGPTSLTRFGFPDTHTLGWGHLLAARGYLCFFPNYRGSMGFGVEFAELNNRDLGGGDLEDVLYGVDYCIAQGWADGERLGIGGWSYGGYITPWAISQTPRFKAAVSGASITNWTSFHGVSPIQGFDETFNRADPHNADGFYTFRSPIYSVERVSTPTLFLHGQEDPVCPVGQAHEMWRALKERGIETRLVIYPRERHGLREREHVRDLLTRIVEWFSERV
jgi:dipeptidyl aminopeptidase/acylaminoacyl peptidase